MTTETQDGATPLSRFIALYLTTTPKRELTELGETQGKLLSEARKELRDPLIRPQNVAELVRAWAEHGWVELRNNYVKLTQVGEPELARIAA